MSRSASDDNQSLTVLVLNSGSSSVKFSLYGVGGPTKQPTEKRMMRGSIERIGLKSSIFRTRNERDETVVERHEDVHDHDQAFDLLFSAIGRLSIKSSPDAVGHRIVHGGNHFVEPRVATQEVMKSLVALTPLAPDHLPHEIKAMKAVERSYPALPQVVCFDTAFHRHMPDVAKMYPLPRFLWGEGARRYGFHGLSYEYIMAELAKQAEYGAGLGRIVIAHLGNGASMAAVKDGKGIDTTMGLTPAGGLMMGTRPGDLDPGVVLYLLQEKGLRASTVNDIINQHSGLLAVSARTPDMHELLSIETTDAHAAEAVNLFCYQAKKFLGALAAALGGIDLFVFTGGIGENAPGVRERICDGLQFLGVEIDPDANRAGRSVISVPGGRVVVRVMKTDEDLMIARHTRHLIGRMQVATG